MTREGENLMNTYLITVAALISLLAANAWCTTIINQGNMASLVIVSYKEDKCKSNSKELKPGESLYVNQTCKRDTIEAIGPGGYSKILATGGYNERGEILTFQFNQKL